MDPEIAPQVAQFVAGILATSHSKWSRAQRYAGAAMCALAGLLFLVGHGSSRVYLAVVFGLLSVALMTTEASADRLRDRIVLRDELGRPRILIGAMSHENSTFTGLVVLTPSGDAAVYAGTSSTNGKTKPFIGLLGENLSPAVNLFVNETTSGSHGAGLAFGDTSNGDMGGIAMVKPDGHDSWTPAINFRYHGTSTVEITGGPSPFFALRGPEQEGHLFATPDTLALLDGRRRIQFSLYEESQNVTLSDETHTVTISPHTVALLSDDERVATLTLQTPDEATILCTAGEACASLDAIRTTGGGGTFGIGSSNIDLSAGLSEAFIRIRDGEGSMELRPDPRKTPEGTG